MGRWFYEENGGSERLTFEFSVLKMGDKNCPNLGTRWDPNTKRCIPCKGPRPGYRITPHCGYDDDGGSHQPPEMPCPDNTFNDGSGAHCKPCSRCTPGHIKVANCSKTTDTSCSIPRSTMAAVPATTPVTIRHVSASSSRASVTMRMQTVLNPTEGSTQTKSHVAWAVPLAIVVSIMLAILLAFIVNKKRKRGQHAPISFSRGSSLVNTGFSPLATAIDDNDLDLNHNILSAPLQTLLDNLDVLEELVILLDPESHRIKNTKHLASLCSFPSTWITYTYSMKESKSPLKALLEGVTSKNPDWTVGHLAKLLRHMERNDAIAVLAKLRLNEIGV